MFKLRIHNHSQSAESKESTLLCSRADFTSAVREIAARLEALKEYNKDQALFVAVDIVRCRLLSKLQSKHGG